jgi:hypothetical protein
MAMLIWHTLVSPGYFAIRFVKEKLGGPSRSEHEKLQAEKLDLQHKYDELLAAHREICTEVPISFLLTLKKHK